MDLDKCLQSGREIAVLKLIRHARTYVLLCISIKTLLKNVMTQNIIQH